MKTKTILSAVVILFIATSSLLHSCKKGDEGIQGQTGTQGIPGPSGSTILSGNTAPSATTGNLGDFYLDLSTSNLYGPKTGSGWGSALSLKGSAGAPGATGSPGATGPSGTNGTNGTNGKTILSGNGIPGGNIGTDGDYYLDKIMYNFYGPKTSGTWGVPTALQGPQGPMGNANIKIDTFTVKSADWLTGATFWIGTSPSGSLGLPTKYFDRSAAALTSNFLGSDGIIMVYMKSTTQFNPDAWIPIPFSFLSFDSGYTFNYGYETLVGKVRLHFYFRQVNSNAPSINTYVLPTGKFKIILATGNVVSSLAASHIDKDDQAAVARYLGVIAK